MKTGKGKKATLQNTVEKLPPSHPVFQSTIPTPQEIRAAPLPGAAHPWRLAWGRRAPGAGGGPETHGRAKLQGQQGNSVRCSGLLIQLLEQGLIFCRGGSRGRDAGGAAPACAPPRASCGADRRLVLDFSPPALAWPRAEPRDRGEPGSGCQRGHLLTEFISITGGERDLSPTIQDSETSRGCARTCAGSTGAQLQPQLRTEATSTRTPRPQPPARCPPADGAPAQAGWCWRPPPWPPSSSASVSHRLPPGCAPRALPSAAAAGGALASPQLAPQQGPAFTKHC